MKKGVFIFLCMVSIIIFLGCNSYKNNLSTSSKCQTYSMKQLDSLIKINVSSKNSVYALSSQLQILKTSDRCKNWEHTFTIEANQACKPDLFVLDDKNAFIVYLINDYIQISKTTNAGQSWTKIGKIISNDYIFSDGSNLKIYFINNYNGFILASSPPASGIMKKTLYKTTDSGKNWSIVSSTDKKDDINLKINGYTSGLSFFNSEIGYITCTYHGGENLPVYITYNFGKDWESISVPIPDEYKSLAYGTDYYIDAYPPAIYGKDRQFAKMELVFCNSKAHNPYIYKSNDGGIAWHLSGRSNLIIKQYSFFNDEYCLGLDESGLINISNNGGEFWSR